MAGERAFVGSIARVYRADHENLVAALADLDDAGLAWRPPRSNSIAFNAWHVARWADRMVTLLSDLTPELRARLRGPRTELWHAEGLARRWSLPTELGKHATGLEIDESAAARLALPGKERLLGYVRPAFAALEEALGALRDADLAAPDPDAETSSDLGAWLLRYLRHEARHLGMIEALKGAQGVRGTATR